MALERTNTVGHSDTPIDDGESSPHWGRDEIVDTFLSVADGIHQDIARLQRLMVEIPLCSPDAIDGDLMDNVDENVEELSLSLQIAMESINQAEWLIGEIRSFDGLARMREWGDLPEIKGDWEYE